VFERFFRRSGAPAAAGRGAQRAAGGEATAALLDAALEHHRAGRLDEAEACYGRVLGTEPDNVDALHFLGVIAYQKGRHEQAQGLIGRALSLNGSNAPAHNNLGNVLQARGMSQEAMGCYRRAIALAPDYVDAYINMGAVLVAADRLPEANECYRALLALAPGSAAGHSNLGHVLFAQGRLEEAIASYREALAIDPNLPEVHKNLGSVLFELGRPEEAADHYGRALALRPEYPQARLGYAIVKLLLGDYAAGLPLFESRFEEGALAQAVYARMREGLAQFRDKSRWLGQDAGGRTLLVWADQGIGDTLMMARYLPLLERRGVGKVLLHCEDALVRLIGGMQGVDRVVPRSLPVPFGEFDYYCPIMSLPLAFDTTVETIPEAVPYLRVPDEIDRRWQRRMRDLRPFRVGLVWAGRRDFPGDDRRSIALDRFAPLLQLADMSFVSLQKGEPAGQIERLGWEIHDWMDECDDFLDTAGVIGGLSLVISVDTSVAHLAGALGKPVWLLNCFGSEWRWMLGRDDSPWYPTMTIFRQHTAGNWDEVLIRVASALEKARTFCRNRGSAPPADLSGFRPSTEAPNDPCGSRC
jgi:tetratricopeptide (TPR) repeat protein